MHVAAKIGLAIAGGAAAGLALEASTNHRSSPGGNFAFLGLGIGGTILNARMLASSSTMPWLSTLGVAAGAMSVGMAIGNMFDGPSATSGVRELAPGPLPSPQPGPAPSPTTELRERVSAGSDDPLRPDGPVEEEVESYGPDGEYLGSEHGTLGG